MGDLGFTHKKCKPPEYLVLLPGMDGFLYPVYALEPDQFYFAGLILQSCHEALAPVFAKYFYFSYLPGHLGIFTGSRQAGDLIQLCLINMAEGIMLQRSLNVKMPSSFFKRPAFNEVTPRMYSMGLFNMEETWLIRLVSTNIQWLAFLAVG